jgi:hypothetical protein
MEKTASPDWNDVFAFLRERILVALFREGGYAKEDCVGRAHFDVADARPLVQARRAVEHAAHIFRASWGR